MMALLVLAVRVDLAWAQSEDVLNVKTHVSLLGQWALEVDPTTREGAGPGHYQMSKAGKVQWSRRMPFTLCEVVVGDDGVVVGYGYSTGVGNNWIANPGVLNVVVLEPDGKVRYLGAIKRAASMMLHGGLVPVARGLVACPEVDSFVLRLSDDDKVVWRVCQLSTGKLIREIDPAVTGGLPPGARALAGMQVVVRKPKPLILTHWDSFSSTKTSGGVWFVLQDLEGRAEWKLHRPHDYDLPDGDAAKDKVQRLLWDRGAILESSGPGMFDLWSGASGERVRYVVACNEPGYNAWNVSEIGREKFTLKEEDEDLPEWKNDGPELRRLGSFVLQDMPEEKPVRDIETFALDGAGRLGFVRGEKSHTRTFVLLNNEGKVRTEIKLPSHLERKRAHLVWSEGERWLLAKSDDHSRAWWLDVGKGEVKPVEGFDCPEIESLANDRRGGFVVLGKERRTYDSVDHLIRFDTGGKVLWDKRQHGTYGKPEELFSPQEATVLANGEIAVVSNIANTVQFFSLDGKYLRTLDLQQAWKREPNYPTGIVPDIEGGYIIRDFHGDPGFVRMKADGTVRSGLRPRFKNKMALEARQGLHVAADGSLWMSDGHAFMELGEDGLVERVVGAEISQEKLGKIELVAGDRQGRVYALDQRSGAVHVFDANGSKLRVCKPGPEDVKDGERIEDLAVADDGTVYLSVDLMRDHKHLKFDPEGRRLKMPALGLDSISEGLHPQPGGNRLLVTGYHEAFLVDGAGKRIKTINRRQDRMWLDCLDDAAVADDGSFALTDRAGGVGRRMAASDARCMHYYCASGDAEGLLRLPRGCMGLNGFNGTHASLRFMGGEVMVVDRCGMHRYRVPMEEGRATRCDHFITRNGRELWVVDMETREVTRFEMPGRGGKLEWWRGGEFELWKE